MCENSVAAKSVSSLVAHGAVYILVAALAASLVYAAYTFVGPTPTSNSIKDLSFKPKRLFIRAFKQEKELEIWAAPDNNSGLTLIRTYPIARMSGKLGPKRREGDLQVPEGLYHIDRFNPNSLFHLSLGLNYPNAADKILADKERPGYDIFIHGSNVSIGCLAMTDPVIEDIYALASQAKDAGQRQIRVHIFPARMTAANMSPLREEFSDRPDVLKLWDQLQVAYDRFESSKKVPKFSVDNTGAYRFPRT